MVKSLNRKVARGAPDCNEESNIRHETPSPFFEIFAETWGNKGGSKVENEPTIRLLVAAEV